MAYEKMHDLLDLAIRMQSSADGVSINDIMQQFEVSRRTAERMRDLIREKFPQIVEDIGEHGIKRWHLPYGTLKDYINFSIDEISALQNAVCFMEHRQLKEQSQILANLLNKIKAMIRPDIICRLEPDAEIMQESEGYAFRPILKLNINPEHLNELRRAVTACRKIRMRYDSPSGNNAWRVIYPYAFIYDKKHYLIAYSEKDRDFRCFNLSKIIELKDGDNYFNRDSNFNLEQYCHRSFGVYHDTPIKVEWLFDAQSADKARDYIFHPSQVMIDNSDGSLSVRFESGGVLEMDRHLYSWGKHVKVIKPRNWKKMVKEVQKNV